MHPPAQSFAEKVASWVKPIWATEHPACPGAITSAGGQGSTGPRRPFRSDAAPRTPHSEHTRLAARESRVPLFLLFYKYESLFLWPTNSAPGRPPVKASRSVCLFTTSLTASLTKLQTALLITYANHQENLRTDSVQTLNSSTSLSLRHLR